MEQASAAAVGSSSNSGSAGWLHWPSAAAKHSSNTHCPMVCPACLPLTCYKSGRPGAHPHQADHIWVLDAGCHGRFFEQASQRRGRQQCRRVRGWTTAGGIQLQQHFDCHWAAGQGS